MFSLVSDYFKPEIKDINTNKPLKVHNNLLQNKKFSEFELEQMRQWIENQFNSYKNNNDVENKLKAFLENKCIEKDELLEFKKVFEYLSNNKNYRKKT